MAREWSLQETKALVDEHIALKEEEKLEVRTASEHWNKVAKKLREKGFNRSHKSCNKRWYRLEQYEIQIFSFNMEEGKEKNYWDLTRFERLEYRGKWPQLPSGDNIDKEIFDALKKFSHQYEKNETSNTTNELAISPTVVDKEVILSEPKVELKRQSAHVATRTFPVSLSHPMIATTELKQQEQPTESQQQFKNTWHAPSIENQPLSSQDALDGFKLQARELRRRRATELRRNNRTVPYNSTHTTFVKVNQPSQQNSQNIQNSAPISETSTFGSITDLINKQIENPNKIAKENVTPTRPPILFKRLSNPPQNTYNMDNNQEPQNTNNVAQEQPIGRHLHFQSQSTTNAHKQERPLPLLHSINSHLPLLQPEDNHSNPKNGVNSDIHHHAPLDGDNLPTELLHLGSLEEQLQVILGVHPWELLVHNGSLGACEQQLHKNVEAPQFQRNFRMGQNHQQTGQSRTTGSFLGEGIGRLGAQLGAIVKLMQTMHAAEHEFREKMFLFMEGMVVSLHNMAQASARTTNP